MELTDRKGNILSSIIEFYIKSGEPVGSKVIADEIGVSSATVRNEMADLLELGFLEQPHTSAGRMPSSKGLRMYVDNLMKEQELSEDEKSYFDSLILGSAYDPEQLLAALSKSIASVAKCVCLCTLPSGKKSKVKAVQFVQTSRRTAMIILMSSAGTMRNRVFHCDFDLTPEIIRMLFRFFNEKVARRYVEEITLPFIQTIGISLGDAGVLASSALHALIIVANETMETDLWVQGKMNLLFYPELRYDGVRQIIDLLEDKTPFERLLIQKPHRVSTLIGDEIGIDALKDCSLMVSRYFVDQQDAGALAVLGPIRMPYPKIKAILKYLTQKVSTILTVLMHEE